MSKQNHISTRVFRPSDLMSVKSLVQSTIDACYPKVYPKEAVQFFKDWHCDQSILKDAKEGYTILLQKDGRIVGTGTILDQEVKRVFVDPAFQGRGFGKLIMRRLEERAVSTGINVVKLDASLPSKTFYDALGYITLESAFREVAHGRRLDFYRMEKALREESEMGAHRISFKTMPWETPAVGARFKAYEHNARRLRLVEFTREFVEPDWCTKGHVGYVLEGRMEVDFDGKAIVFGPGDGLFIRPGDKHKAKVLTDRTRIILVEDV